MRQTPPQQPPAVRVGRSAAGPVISKSHYLDWLQCPKLAWHRFNAPERLAEPDAAAQAVMKQGQEVTQLAWGLFPGGEAVGGTGQALRDMERTAQLLAGRHPLFEATFGAGPAFVRVDVLAPAGSDAWDLIEVKSTTKVEKEHEQDIAFQASVLRAAGVRLRRCQLAHLRRDYVRQGALKVNDLFLLADVTARIEPQVAQASADLPEINRLRRRRGAPSVPVGSHCESPRRCPLCDVCWQGMPETNVFTLYRGGKRATGLFKAGVQDIARIPGEVALTARQQIQRAAVVSRRPQLNGPALQRFLARLEYPLALLDFEAFATAVPLFDGLRPYQQVPFQFSCHVVAGAEAEPEARGWIARQAKDPRQEFMEELRRQLPARGSIVVYNASFECGRLAECAEFLPKFRRWIGGLKPRFVDLLEPFREFHYYHPDQHGSASIKAVLPALTGRSYDDLAIRDGATAAQRYLEVTFGKAGRAERERVWDNLERYCGRDTLAMLWVLEALQRLVATPR